MASSVHFLLGLVLTFTAFVRTESECYEVSDFTMTSEDGVLKLNGKRFNLKGVAWFGFETANNCVHGLWSVDYHSIINFLKDNGFNGLRLPFSVDLANGDKSPVSINFYKMNEELKGLSSLSVMDKI